MLSTSHYPVTSPVPFNPHTHARRRPKLSLQMPTLTINTSVSTLPSAHSLSLRTPLSPTSRNTQFNRRLQVPVPITLSPVDAETDVSSDEEPEAMSAGRREYRMESAYHPVTPRVGFFPARNVVKKKKKSVRVAFSDDVVVITREWDAFYDHCE